MCAPEKLFRKASVQNFQIASKEIFHQNLRCPFFSLDTNLPSIWFRDGLPISRKIVFFEHQPKEMHSFSSGTTCKWISTWKINLKPIIKRNHQSHRIRDPMNLEKVLVQSLTVLHRLFSLSWKKNVRGFDPHICNPRGSTDLLSGKAILRCICVGDWGDLRILQNQSVARDAITNLFFQLSVPISFFRSCQRRFRTVKITKQPQSMFELQKPVQSHNNWKSGWIGTKQREPINILLLPSHTVLHRYWHNQSSRSLVQSQYLLRQISSVVEREILITSFLVAGSGVSSDPDLSFPKHATQTAISLFVGYL